MGLKRNKKGLAEIITVILIILLSLAAIVIIWQVIKPLIYKTTSQVSLSCTTGVELTIRSANCSGNVMTVRLERGNVEDAIKSMKFVFSNGDDSQTVELSKTAGDKMPSGLDVITYSFDRTARNMTITNVTSVKIAPTMDGEGGSDLTCPVVAEQAC